jgi:hypothetical protein
MEIHIGYHAMTTCRERDIVILVMVYQCIIVNYCSVCKREYKEKNGRQTRHCPTCGTTLVQISDDSMDRVRRDKLPKKS